MINANEWRALENLNPTDDGHGDEYWRPANMAVVGAPPPVDSARNTSADLAVALGERRNGAHAGGH